MKKIFLLLLLCATTLASCRLEEPDIFPKSSAERMDDYLANFQEKLCSAPNGWVMEYFPNASRAGYVFLMKFGKGGDVKIGARNAFTGNAYADSTSLYEMISDNGPILSFSTYNNLFHIFANPENPDGTGMEGDYEFIALNNDNLNQITLKSKKRGVYINMNRLPDTQDWSEYFAKIYEIGSLCFGNRLPLQLSDGKKSYILRENYSLKVGEQDVLVGSPHIFRATIEGGNVVSDGVNIPFIVTDYGLRFFEPFEMESGLRVQTFKLSDDNNSLQCIDAGAEAAKIGGINVLDLFFEIIDNKTSLMSLFTANSMSAEVSEIYNSFITACAESEYPMSLREVALRNSATYGYSLFINALLGGSSTLCYFIFDVNRADAKLKLSFTGEFDKDGNGKFFYNDIEEGKQFVDMLTNEFTLTYAKNIFDSTIRFTAANNPNIWFDVVRK